MILQSRIGAGKFLFGKRGFFFDPDNTGGVSHGNDPSQQQLADPNQGQSQQSTSPFADIDKDLLDDKTREAITKAEQQFATIANQAKQSRDFQSRFDQTKAELDRLQNQVTRGEIPSRQQQQAAPATFQDEIFQEYLANNIPEPQAKQLAAMNAKLYDRHAQRITGQIQQNMMPVISNVVDNNARDAFASVQANDRLGIFQNEEVAQQLWDRTQAMAKEGTLVTPEVVQNLGRIYWAQSIEKNGMPTSVNQQQQQQQPMDGFSQNGGNGQQQQTRFTYPGAGMSVRPLQFQNNNRPVDAETAAAIGATVAGWPVKPKAFRTGK